MAGEKKSGYHPGGGVRRPIRRVKRPTVSHSGGTPKRTPTTGRRRLRAPTPIKRQPPRMSVDPKRPTTTRRRRAGLTGKANINPNLSATQKAADSFNKRRAQAKTRELLSKRTPTQARPARRSTRGSTPRSNPMSRFRQAGRRAMSRFNRRR